MKKVLYVITSLAHKRAFEMFEERADLEQLVLGPTPVISKDLIVPEDYSDFKINSIKHYNNKKEMQAIVNSFGPDIYVEASLPVARGISLPKKCKKAYVSHGMVGNHVVGMLKQLAVDTSVWIGNDLYCGATSVFSDWIKRVAKVGDDKILINALPQLDILCDKAYYESYRARVLAKTKHPNAKKVVLFVGFCCKDRYDFAPHNQDYFATAIELERIARENDWLVMIKPRQTYDEMMRFLRTHGWGKKYIEPYKNIQTSKYLHFITTTGHIYRYFFADAIVINGTSTIEVEACAAQKPLFIVQTDINRGVDAYDAIKKQAAIPIPDQAEIEHDLKECLENGRFYYPDNQRKLIDSMSLSLDGNMHKRIQDRLAKM